MTRTSRLATIILVALASVLMGAFIAAPVPAPALSPVTAPVPVELPTADGAETTTDDTPPVTVDPVPSPPADGAVPSVPADGAVPSVPADGAVPSVPADGADTATADGAVPPVPAEGADTATADDSSDWFDPTDDALPADAPEVCQILDMGAAACDSFVHPEPGEISVAVIYVEDDEYAIDQIIAYDEHGPVEYVNFWEGGTLPTE